MISFIEITSLEIKYNKSKVFDLEVEDAHQYIANNYIVHNCTTSCNTAIHYAMASLINDVSDVRWKIQQSIVEADKLQINCPYKSIPLVVADGGFDNYDKIIKALALGADYVMIGKLFAQCEEACGAIKSADASYRYREYYGMSTKRAQTETGNKVLKTAEGIETTVPVLYTVNGWCDNFISYLRSAMSYTNSFDLDDFKNAEYKIVSPLEYLSFYK